MAEEKSLETKVKKFLKDEGCWYIKYWGGGGFTKSGIPDLLVCCGGVFLGVELKAPRGKPTDLQIRNLHKIKDAGGLSILLYPDLLSVFKNLIHAIKDGNPQVMGACMEILEERINKYE